ncbi:MAG: hypothetical protein NC911_11060 [Candidatus Omnitrophica bacterium]|nr:hypothetical protein [Candidatus Omnitrophota bacterium]
MVQIARGILLGFVFGRLLSAEPWWNSSWNRRCRVVIPGVGQSVKNFPVIIPGKQIKLVAGNENVSLGSIRVIASGKEIPSQVDEFDDQEHPASQPNHFLNDNDELVFQIDIPEAGTEVWVYWSTEPLPPAAYHSSSLIGEAMEPSVFQHDLQMWNDQVIVGLRGPARGADPSKNSIENWGAGSLVWLDVFRSPVLHFRGSWSSIFPLGAIACRPGQEANRWVKPWVLVRGPVRLAGATRLDGTKVKTDSGEIKLDVFHRVWLFDKGAMVCFEEFLSPHEEVKNFRQEFAFGFQLTGVGQEVLYYSQPGTLKSFSGQAEDLQAARENKIIATASGLEDWFACYSLKEKTGYAYFLGKAQPGEKRENSFYTRIHGAFRSSRSFSLRKGEPMVNRFWVAGLREATGADFQALAKFFSGINLQFGLVEKK